MCSAHFTDDDKIMILEVRENTPAYQSGLRSGDKILSFNGTDAPSYKSLISFVGTLHYERGVELLVMDKQKTEKMVHFTIAVETSTGIIIIPPSAEMNLTEREKV